MDFELFVKSVAAKIEEETGNIVEPHEVHKNNLLFKGIMIKDGSGVNPVVYLESYYEDFRKGKYNTLGEVADVILRVIKENDRSLFTDELLSRMRSKEYLLQNVIPCLLPDNEMNAEIFSENVNRDFLNLKVVYKVRVPEISLAGTNGCYMVTTQMRNLVGLTDDEIHEAAITNANDALTIGSLADVLQELTGECVDGSLPLLVVSNTLNHFGAASILCEDKLREYLEKRQCEEVIILPSSRHEVIMFENSDCGDMEAFKEMVEMVNMTEVCPEDKLSDNVYAFNTNTGFRIVA